MKFRPVRIDEKPLMKTPTPVVTTYEFENVPVDAARFLQCQGKRDRCCHDMVSAQGAAKPLTDLLSAIIPTVAAPLDLGPAVPGQANASAVQCQAAENFTLGILQMV